jgi:outer membrane receptor for ferrienterochelin and colicin
MSSRQPDRGDDRPARSHVTAQYDVASFNYNKQSGADGSDANDFASLRGLGFDQTLVLINGKRRHLSAFCQ